MIDGVMELSRIRHVDSRGWFERIYDSELALPNTYSPVISQIAVSQNDKRLTLRGLHGMKTRRPESKIVECLIGSIFDVVVDLRTGSPTYLDHMTITLEESNPRAILIPPGCLHGYLTLTDSSLLCYQFSTPYSPDSEIGYRWDEPCFGIKWPESPEHISHKDLNWSSFGNTNS